MRVVVQRVKEADVKVGEAIVGSIGKGFMVLVGVEEEDSEEDVAYVVKKVSNMRIFEDESGKMNLSLKKVDGKVLSISQFTLHADTRKGNRPSFTQAAKPDKAIQLYEAFNEGIKAKGIPVETGTFGEEMDVSLINDGPVTIIVDSKNK